MRALLINPYIYDFAAYSFWSSPLGLLYMGGVLRKNGVNIQLIDCLKVIEDKRKEDGRAPFLKQKVALPDALKHVKRRLKRYGISREALMEELFRTEQPDLVLVTSAMTYWYLGVKEIVEAVREVFPETAIVVGGIYPSLCYDHAVKTMTHADLIVQNNEIDRFNRFLEERFSITLPCALSMDDLDGRPFPCYDLYEDIAFVPLLTSMGCMYKCTYCATPYMHPRIVRRNPQNVIDEVRHWHDRGVERYVVYDDNFLYRSDLYGKPLLRSLRDLPFSIRIYNPNAVNAALVDGETARLLFEAGFKEVRIGLESADPGFQKSTGGKVDRKTFEGAVGALTDGGFTTEAIIPYILAGLPRQRWQDVKTSIDYAASLGLQANIAEYTPIPHTPLFEEFKTLARYPIGEEPMYQNNALLPFAWDGFTENDMLYLKAYAKEVNRKK